MDKIQVFECSEYSKVKPNSSCSAGVEVGCFHSILNRVHYVWVTAMHQNGLSTDITVGMWVQGFESNSALPQQMLEYIVLSCFSGAPCSGRWLSSVIKKLSKTSSRPSTFWLFHEFLIQMPFVKDKWDMEKYSIVQNREHRRTITGDVEHRFSQTRWAIVLHIIIRIQCK